MRPIHLARMDKTRPVIVLTRAGVRSRMSSVTLAPITTRVRGLATEVPVGQLNGLDQAGVVSCDNITTIQAELLGRHVGALLPEQEEELTAAILAAFDLA